MNHSVYDLGNVDREILPAGSGPREVAGETQRREKSRQADGSAGSSPMAAARNDFPAGQRRKFDMGTTLSLFVPGMGQMVRGRPDLGVLFLSSGAFLSSLAWATWTTRADLAQTLPFLGLSRAWGLRALLVFYGLAAVLHITAVIGGIRPAGANHPRAGVLTLASALVPGWGQALAGRAWRAGFCLAGLWAVGFAWLVSSPPLQMAMAQQNLILPAGMGFIISPLVLYTGPAVLWAVTMSDAFHGRDAGV